MNKRKILLIGQTPPPYGGQAISIEYLLKGNYTNFEFEHVKMHFSNEMSDIGKFQIRKIFHLFKIICHVYYKKFRHRINIMVYHPGGPDLIPMIRDIIFLTTTRWLFAKTILWFHAGGVGQLYKNLSPNLKFLFRKAYYYVDYGIKLSELSPNDCDIIKVKNEVIIPIGIPDESINVFSNSHVNKIPIILFVGVIRESKGILILLEACKILLDYGYKFKVNVVGKFESSKFEQLTYRAVKQFGLDYHINFTGVLLGMKKIKVFSTADIFCFPSFFESENFPAVLLEAGQFKLPIVTTYWRGIPTFVKDGKSGFLVPIRDSKMIAEKLGILLRDYKLRKRMGDCARVNYLKNYTIDKYYNNIEKFFSKVLNHN